MGKRYYCDYCERSFADGAENRKKHLASIHHQKLRKAHYDSFKSASDRLEEEKLKKPCRKFHDSGHCDFGPGCKYSHMTAQDIQALKTQEYQEKLSATVEKPRLEPDIDSWLKTKILKIDKVTPIEPSAMDPLMPSVLSTISNLPPSLIPCKPSELLNAYKESEAQWG